MTAQEIYQNLKNKFGENVISISEEPHYDTFVEVVPAAIKEIAMYMRDQEELGFDYLSLLTGMDYKDSLGVVYHIQSLRHGHKIVLKVRLNREKPELPSIERVWKTANWHEREAYDMFGIIFEGHFDLERILCPDDWVGYPLRKDYTAPTEYHGMDATPNL